MTAAYIVNRILTSVFEQSVVNLFTSYNEKMLYIGGILGIIIKSENFYQEMQLCICNY